MFKSFRAGVILFFLLFARFLPAQDISSIKLDKFYSGSFNEILDNISHEHGVKFEYDSARCAQIYIADHPIQLPLTSFLNGICKKNKLQYYISADTVIHITDITPKTTKQIFLTTRHDTIAPTRFNFFLAGTVKDEETNEALPFATITIKGTLMGVTANADGFFTLYKVPTDTSTLVVQYLGYTKTEVYLTPAMVKQNLIIGMKPVANSLAQVEISAEREDLLQVNNRSISTIKMTPKSLEQLPNVGEKDIFRSLQLMPGISAANESSSGLYIRGGTPDQNLILYDGFTVYHVDHLYGFFSAFNSYAIKDVQLYKGGYESRFGGRLSSVTEITGKDGNQNFNIGGDVSLLSVNVFTEIPIGKKFTSVAAFRRSFKGPLYNTIFDKFNTSSSDNQQAGPGPGGNFNTQATSFFYDLNAKLSYRPTEKDIISFSFFNGTDKLDNGFSASPSFGGVSRNFSITDLTRYGNMGSSLKWARTWNTKLYSSTIMSYSYYYSTRDRTNENSFTDSSGAETTFKMGTLESNYLNDCSVKYDLNWSPVAGNKFQGGIFSTYYDIKYKYSQNDTSYILNKHTTGVLIGAYVQDEISLFKGKLTALPGIRVDYFDITKKTYYEPRISAVVDLSKRLILKAAYGKYYQFANRVVREDILSGSRDFWILSDGESVPVSYSYHYILGLSYENVNYLFSAEAYHKDLVGLSEYSVRFRPNQQGITYEENFYNGTGYAEGIEFLLQRKFGKFKGWTSYTLGRAVNHFDVYSTEDYPAEQDVTHEFKIVGLYKWKRWEFSATWIYATGRPYTAPSGAYSVQLLDGTSESYFTVTSKNSLRLPDYHRMDLAVNYRFKNAEENDIGYLGFSLFNAYNHTNVWYKQYEILDNQIVETNVNYLGITPNLTLSLKLR